MERPLQRPQAVEELSMPLGTTQVKEDTSGVFGMIRGTMLILIDVRGLGDSKSAHQDPSFDGAHLLFQRHAE